MLLAELHGKIPSKLDNKEDILTSNVFSFFKYANRSILKEYLNYLGLIVTLKDAENSEFIFWQSYTDGTEPDLVIICGKYYILFEAKLFSDFSPKNSTSESQIDREVEMGLLESKNVGKEFVYIAITAEYYKNIHKYSKLDDAKFKFIWTNWQFVTFFLETLLSNNNLSNQYFTKDLYDLLLKKKLRSFKGISDIQYSSIITDRESIFYNLNTSKFKGEFTGYSKVLSEFEVITDYEIVFKKSFFKISTEYKDYNYESIFYNGK